MRAVTRFPLLAAALLAFAIGGCDDPVAPPAPPALDRPESVSFFCWSRSTGAPVPLASCVPDDDPPDDALSGSPEPEFELHAVVTQTATGEVAAVQVTGDEDDPPGVIDSDVRVPGFTFAPVGDLPAAVVTPSGDPAHTYVVSRGSSALHVIETASFRTGVGAVVTPVERAGRPFFAPEGGRVDGGMPDGGMPDGGMPDGGTPDGALAPVGRPSAMVLAPGEDELIVAVPELGEVWFVPIVAGAVGDPLRVPLSATVPEPVDLTAVPASERPPTYRVTCPRDRAIVDPEPVPPRTPVSAGATPRPWALAVDAELGRLLVADSALPVIHVLDLATHAELAAINVGVPTRELVLTPRVPAQAGDTEHTERFLYAIDDASDSVLAVDYTDPARASFGAVLTVSPSAPQDRLPVPALPRAIEVVTPTWPDEGVPACTPDEETPAILHGVFLAVATIDGRVRIFDIFDIDAPCRGNDPACGGAGAHNDDDLVAIGRHRPRIGAFVDEPITVDPAPAWDIGGTTATVDASTGVADDVVSTLGTLTCPEGLGMVFGDPGGEGAADDKVRVCAVTDPWAATSQIYTATWQGAIPSTTMTGASFDPSAPAIDVRFDPCALGVLGSADVPGSGALGNYAGDVVAITSPLPAATADDETCERLVQERETGEGRAVLLPLVSASSAASRPSYAGRLVLGERTVNAAGADGGFSLDEVRACFPELVELEVRVRGAFVFQSTRAGFRHPIVAGADGTCEVDPAAVARDERGRAFPDQIFRTPEIALSFVGAPVADQAVLELTTSDVPLPLAFNISFDATSMTDLPSLLAELEYNEIDDHLYVVDQARRGLVRIDLTSPDAFDFFR